MSAAPVEAADAPDESHNQDDEDDNSDDRSREINEWLDDGTQLAGDGDTTFADADGRITWRERQVLRIQRTLPDGRRLDWSTRIEGAGTLDHCPGPGGVLHGQAQLTVEHDLRLVGGPGRPLRLAVTHRADSTLQGAVDQTAALIRLQQLIDARGEVRLHEGSRRHGGDAASRWRAVATPDRTSPVSHDPADFEHMSVEGPVPVDPDSAGLQLALRSEADRGVVFEALGRAAGFALDPDTLWRAAAMAQRRWRDGACVVLEAVEGESRPARPGEVVTLRVRSWHRLGQPLAERLPLSARPRQAWLDRPVSAMTTAEWRVAVVGSDGAMVAMESVSERGIARLDVSYGPTERLRITVEGFPPEMQDPDVPCRVRQVYEGPLAPLGGVPGRVGGRWTQRHDNTMCADIIVEADGRRDIQNCLRHMTGEMDARGDITGPAARRLLRLELTHRPATLRSDDRCGLDAATLEFLHALPVLRLPPIELPVPGQRRREIAIEEGKLIVEWLR